MSTGTIQEVLILNWTPVRLNQLIGYHPMTAHRHKRKDRDLIHVYCLRAGITKATGKRRVHLTIMIPPRGRAADPDAYWKSLLDGLVHCGALKGDSRQWVELAPVTFIKAQHKGTLITLEDIPSGR